MKGLTLKSNPHQMKLFYFENYASSLIYPDFILSDIESKQASGRYSQPYTPLELEALIGPF
jgi:hypothetical protein